MAFRGIHIAQFIKNKQSQSEKEKLDYEAMSETQSENVVKPEALQFTGEGAWVMPEVILYLKENKLKISFSKAGSIKKLREFQVNVWFWMKSSDKHT